MRKLKTIISLCVAIICFIMSTVSVQGLSTSVISSEQAPYSIFDYSIYEEKSLEELIEYLNELEKDEKYKLVCKYLKADIEISKDLESEIKKDSYYLYILKDRLQAELNNNILIPRSICLELLDKINAEIEVYEQEVKEKRLLWEKQRALEQFREEQIDWSAKFVEMFHPKIKFNWLKNEYRLKNINIYEYFSDGEWCAPIKEPNYTKINKSYIEGHYGIDIAREEGDEILSVANNAEVSILDNCVLLTLDSGTTIVYKNIIPSVEHGSIVNKKDVIGTFSLIDDTYDGLFFTMIKDEKEVSTVWMMGKLPFITEKGMSMPLYIQFDPLWGGLAYGSGRIGGGGCGPSALAMAISYVKNEIITPPDVVRACGGSYYTKGVGSSWTLMPRAAKEFEVNCVKISDSQIIEELEKGHPIVACMRKGKFTDGGHFITLSGIDENGMILVNDSADTIWKQHYAQSFTLKLIKQQSTGLWAISSMDES